MSVTGAIAALILAAAAPAAGQCAPIPGWDTVLAKKKVRWIVAGEMHGTNEMPEIFADAVCLTAQARNLVVALEYPASDQPAIDAYLASDGGAEARQALLEAEIWNSDFKDGRSSEAMFRLLERLRRFRAAGKIRAVIAFQPAHFRRRPSAAELEKAMAERIRAKTPKGATLLVLVGSVHALRTKVRFDAGPYLPMAGHLPAGKTLTLEIAGDGGSAWVCMGSNPCGPTAIGGSGAPDRRGVTISGNRNAPFGGRLFLGTRTTASAPQTRPVARSSAMPGPD